MRRVGSSTAKVEVRPLCNASIGLVFNIAHFSIQDGPGIRTTVFFKGCPLRCWWCHNPESQSPRPEVIYFRERCRLCGECVDACPEDALSLGEEVFVDETKCKRCGTCVDTCLADARSVAGKQMTVAEVLAKAERDRVFYDESGGGVTLSGGEPLMQPEFAEKLLIALKERGIHTAVDTCGYVSTVVLTRIAHFVDLFLFDIKVIDCDRHVVLTGVRNELILKNLAFLASQHGNVVVRVPVIPGFTNDGANLSAICALTQAHGIKRVDLLPYHNIAKDKYQRLGMEYRLADVVPPTPERMHEIADELSRTGVEVRIGG